MRLEALRVKSPEMAIKTIQTMQIVYNMVNVLQLKAISGQPILIDEIGYELRLEIIVVFRGSFAGLQNRPQLLRRKMEPLEERIAERVLLIRTYRHQP